MYSCQNKPTWQSGFSATAELVQHGMAALLRQGDQTKGGWEARPVGNPLCLRLSAGKSSQTGPADGQNKEI